MLWAFLGQRFLSRRVGGFIYLKPYRTMASRIPVNSPQITFPQIPLFSSYPKCQNNLAPVQQVLYQITSDRFSVLLSGLWSIGVRYNFVSEFCVVCSLCQSLVVFPPPSNIVVCVGSLFENSRKVTNLLKKIPTLT